MLATSDLAISFMPVGAADPTGRALRDLVTL
jgi:hypothetical protein